VSTSTAAFWQEHVLAGPYASIEESRASLHARLNAYPKLLELMPIEHPFQTVLDFGCGPGHDVLLMLTLGRVQRVYYADISRRALEITTHRLELHGLRDRGIPLELEEGETPILPRVDQIHCAGVLHHTANPGAILRAFRKALRPEGVASVMVYDGERSEHTQSDVPITRWWRQAELAELAEAAGFTVEYRGSYACSAPWRPSCYAACYALR
jgi:2-polyprenyl-3-methyl-5-hydroxy-6-metoxy-1,4-benzoquinol methylase